MMCMFCFAFFFSSRRRHTRFDCDWSSDVCSSDLPLAAEDYPASLAVWTRTGDPVAELRLARLDLPPPLMAAWVRSPDTRRGPRVERRSEERRVGKECRSRWSPYH